MNLVRDTQVALGARTDPLCLSATARTLMRVPRATVRIRVASLSEVASKHSLGRGELPAAAEASGGTRRFFAGESVLPRCQFGASYRINL